MLGKLAKGLAVSLYCSCNCLENWSKRAASPLAFERAKAGIGRQTGTKLLSRLEIPEVLEA